MRALAILFVALCLSTPAWAQSISRPSADRTYATATEIAAIMDKAAAEAAAGKPGGGGSLLKLGPYASTLEYRTAVGTAGVHERDDELFFVVEGSGVLMTGGRLTDPRRTNSTTLLGAGVEGGTPRKVGKGDTFIVPRNTPHWFSAIDGRLVMISMKLPDGPPAPQP